MRTLVKHGAVALCVGALALAGCGGSDDDGGEVSASAEVEAQLDEELDAVEDIDLGDIASGACAEAVAAMAEVAGGMTAAFTGEVDQLEEAVDAMNEVAEAAPDAISDDMQLVAAAYADFVAVLIDLDLGAGEVPDDEAMAALEDATGELDTDELESASQRIQAYFDSGCEE